MFAVSDIDFSSAPDKVEFKVVSIQADQSGFVAELNSKNLKRFKIMYRWVATILPDIEFGELELSGLSKDENGQPTPDAVTLPFKGAQSQLRHLEFFISGYSFEAAESESAPNASCVLFA